MTTSILILTLNAEKYLDKLLNRLSTQTLKLDEIIVLDSESDDKTVEICKSFPMVKVVPILRKDFDHGGTRNIGFDEAKGDFVFCLSQDVLPINNTYLEDLIKPLLKDDKIVAASGRQIAYPDASIREKLVREFNYKSESFIRDRSDIDRLGIKTYFLSDCCSVYRKSAFYEVGKYDVPYLAMGDMILAHKIINHDYKIAYCAKSEVYHSHDYDLKTQYKRNFDTGATMAMYSNLFGHLKTESEGVALAKFVLRALLKKGHIFSAFYFCIDCAVRLFAYKSGYGFKKLTNKQILKKTLNRGYWVKFLGEQ